MRPTHPPFARLCASRIRNPSSPVLAVIAAGFLLLLDPRLLHAQHGYTAPRSEGEVPLTVEKPFAVTAESAPLPPEQATPGDVAAYGTLAQEVSAVPRRFQWAVRLNVRTVYDDNIYLRQDDRIADIYFAFEPGITLGFGDIVGKDANYVRIDYTPTAFLFLEQTDANAIQHLFRLDGRYRFGRLTLNVAQDIQFLEGGDRGGTSSTANPGPNLNLDTGGATDVNIYTTRADLTYDLSGKTFLSGGLLYSANDYEVLISSEQISSNLFINYTYSPKLIVGLGGTAGYNTVESPNGDQTFQQANLRFSYEPSGKLSVNASFGVEFRQYGGEGDTGGGVTSPVYELSANYQPFDGTTINVRGSRRSLNSAVLQSQNYNTTNITFTGRQRFLRRFYFGLVAGYESAEYYSTDRTDGFASSSRSDNYVFVQPSVDVTLTAFWTAGLYYLYRNNESSSEFFSFYGHQLGVRTSVAF
jgi:hypothetical protein